LIWNPKAYKQFILFWLILSLWAGASIGQGCNDLDVSNCRRSQNQANVWFFGKFAGLNFNTDPVTVLTNNYVIEQLEGNACISDSLGNFLLSTGGFAKLSVWNHFFHHLEGGFNLTGNISATQSSLIIPRPGKESNKYIFSLNLPADHPAYENGLTYSLVDISYERPEGNVITNNVILESKVSEKISAVKHKNGKDIWVLVHLWNSNAFHAYLVTENGLMTNPVVSNVGSFHSADGFDINQAVGQMKLSPDGTMLVLAIYGKNTFEVFEFNNDNGTVLNPSTSLPVFTGAYGVEFSSDGQLLYCSTLDVDGNPAFNSMLYQFKVDNGQVNFDEGEEIAMNAEGSYFCALQLAPDGKIYVARSPGGSVNLGVIHNPTREGVNCNFNSVDHILSDGLDLLGNESRYGLPGFIQSYFCLPKFNYSYNCHGDLTQFRLRNKTNVDSVRWYAKNEFSSNELDFEYQFNSPGTYTVRLTDYFNGIGYTDSMEISINPLPIVQINSGVDTVILLPDSYVTLDAGSGFITYEWSTGQSGQMISPGTEGYYWVDISNNNCCYQRDSVYVELINIVIPNAFIPSGTGFDKYFRIIDQEDVISTLRINIYDRWGKLVFESDTKYFKWDGKGYGTGVFYYTLSAKLINGYNYEKNGNVTLIR